MSTRCFPRIVGGVPGAVAGPALPGHHADLLGESGDGEPLGCGRQDEDRGQRGAHPGLVQVDATDPGGADLRRGGEFVEGVVG